MLKIGCCIGSFITADDRTGMSVLKELKKAGYDYSEIPLFAVMELNDDEFQKLLNEIEKSGVPAEACNSFFPGTLRLTGPDRDPEKISDYLQKCFDRIEKMGVKRLVFGSAGAKNIPEGYSYHKAFAEVVSVLKEAAPLAEKAGCIIVIEPLNRKESNFINTTAEGMLLAEAVSHPNVQLLVDYYHYMLENDHLLPPMMSALHHCHFADPEGRKYPLEWKKEFQSFVQELEENGYHERISIEASPENGLSDLYLFPKLVRMEQ